MRNTGLELKKYVIYTTDGAETVQYAADADTAVHLAGIKWEYVLKVEAA